MRSTSTVIPSLIVVDLDGTLSVLNEYSPECREAMRKVQEKGSRAVLATARGIEEGEVYAVGSYYSLDYLILEGGNVILEKQDRDYGRIEAWDEKLRKEKADLRLFREIFLGRYEKVDDSFRGVPFWKLFIEPISGEEFHAFVHSEVVVVDTPRSYVDPKGRVEGDGTGAPAVVHLTAAAEVHELVVDVEGSVERQVVDTDPRDRPASGVDDAGHGDTKVRWESSEPVSSSIWRPVMLGQLSMSTTKAKLTKSSL